VDRGNWGVEVFLLLLAWKIARPSAIYLTRGNHETHFPQASYGFKGEIAAKLGSDETEGVSEEPIGCWRLFCDICMALPLAIIGGRNSGDGVVVLHGGIPRSPSLQKTRSKKRKRRPKFASLDDIHEAAAVYALCCILPSTTKHPCRRQVRVHHLICAGLAAAVTTLWDKDPPR